MKVLFVTAAYPPMKAGEADHAYHQCMELAKRGLDVHVLTTESNTWPHEVPFTVHPIMRDWSWSDLPRFARFVKRCAPDHVFLYYIGWVYNFHPMITFAPTICRALLPPHHFVTMFAYPMGCDNDKFSVVTRVVRRAVERWASPHGADYVFGTLLRDSDGVIVMSERHRRMLADQYAPVEKKTILIPPPPLLTMAREVTAEQRQETRAKLGFSQEHVVFVYFGYIYPPKGVETLLHAFHIISKEQRHARLLLIGGVVAHEYTQRPRFAEEMRALPKQLGFDHQVVWTGEFATDSDQASRYIYAADVCVFSHDLGSYLNNSSLAAAAAHGLPIVATQPSYVESAFVDGDNLLFCEPKSPESMAAAMRRILEDSELRNRLARGAVRLASDWFSWEKATTRIIEAMDGTKAVREETA